MGLGRPDLEGWLAGASETPGSWWVDWNAWLKERSGELVPARTPGATLGAIEPAPGSYVRVRFDRPPEPPQAESVELKRA